MGKCVIMNSVEFRSCIKELLKQNKMTYKELALKLNMEPSKLTSTLHYRRLMPKQQMVSEICRVLNIDEVIISDNNYNSFIINPDPDYTFPEYMVISEVEFANIVRARRKTKLCKHIDSIANKLHLKESVVSNIFNGAPNPCQYTSIDVLLNICKYYSIDPSKVFKNEYVETIADEKQKFISSLKFILKTYDITEGDIAMESGVPVATILKILNDDYYPPKNIRDSIRKALEKDMSHPKKPENKKDTMTISTKELDIIKKNKKMAKLRKKIKSLNDEDFMELASWIFTLTKKRARKRKKK